MDRRQYGKTLFKQRFDEFGLSAHFEFIRRNWDSDRGRLITVRCKGCGETFDTYNAYEIFRGRIKNLTCPACGLRSDGSIQFVKSKQCKEAMELYLKGYTSNEVIEKYGITTADFENARRAWGIEKSSAQRAESWQISLLKARENTLNKTKCRHAELLNSLGFDYIERRDKKVTIRCQKCGCVLERTAESITTGKIRCPKCAKDEKEKKKTEQAQERKAKQETERMQKNPLGLSYYQLEREKRLDAAHVCEVCGKEYTIRDRIEEAGKKYCRDTGCCSPACDKKRARRKLHMNGFPKSHLHRAHKYGCEYDGSVTLKKLIKRDGLRCAICGGMCDPNDHGWTEYFGPTSPTIDHIQPMSKGGGHIWENVQVAHALCNSIKRDNLEGEQAYEAS